MTRFKDEQVDVAVGGGGPIGLLIAYGLQSMGISTCVIEKDEKSKMAMYGRAASLYPRSLELLDSYGLLHEMTQIGYIVRGSVSHKGWERVTRGGWQSQWANLANTYLDFNLSLRLKCSEEIFQAVYENIGGRVLAGWKLTDMKTDLSSQDDYRVTSEATHVSTGVKRHIMSKYLVGADGGKSAVRHLANIEMEGTGSPYNWVRIDGIVETDMPDANIGVAFIESDTHGTVLWLRLERGASRIGFSLPPSLIEKYGETISQEDAIREAQAAMSPFKCEFKRVDWHTLYSLRQGLAETFVKDNCIILAGDCAHIHSSAAAQGMNTGIHDATNIAWKLAGVLKGWFDPAVLDTYNLERRTSAQTLISLDKKISSLISGTIPDEYQTKSGESKTDPNEILGKVLGDSTQFNVGLGISYKENMLNQAPKASSLTPGHRAPDKLLYGPGSHVPVRLQTVCRNTGHFWILVFAGEPLLTKSRIQAFRTYLDSSKSILKQYPASAFKFLTLIVGNKADGLMSLGNTKFGDIIYDRDSSCHLIYGITPENGAIVVLRPDGIFGFATPLTEGEVLGGYFSAFMLKQDAAATTDGQTLRSGSLCFE